MRRQISRQGKIDGKLLGRPLIRTYAEIFFRFLAVRKMVKFSKNR